MSLIRVNTNNAQYIATTNNKGKIGIGTPYIDVPSDSNSIEVQSSVVSARITALQAYKQEYSAFINGLSNRSNLNKTENTKALKRRLRDILYPVGVGTPPEVAGNNVDTFFPYNLQTSNPQSVLNDWFIPIIDGWIKLFSDIRANVQGLASPLSTPVTPITPIPPSGNVDVDDGTKFTDIVWQTNNIVAETYGSVEIELVIPVIKLSDALYSASVALIDLKTIQFFDKEREYKTVLNFGNDNQYLIEAWRPVASDTSSIQVKLFDPINNTNIQNFTFAYIGRELANSVIDTISIDLPSVVEQVLSLRPKNVNVGKFAVNQAALKDATIQSLNLSSGSIGNISNNGVVSYDDRVFNRWYTADFNSSELNIDFGDYNNFVHFGSATKRLESFKQKLRLIEGIAITASISSSNISERRQAEQREHVKRNFDAYEQYLYFAPQTEEYHYSASAYYTDTGTEYHATGSWPKSGSTNIPYLTNSEVATSWYETQYNIAKRYDEHNQNYLVYHLPQHIQEDSESEEFLRFIAMFGHVMDNLKSYIDQYPNIYSTSPNPTEELTMDQVYEVATAFGLNLPNAYSLEKLQTLISDVYGEQGSRELVAETWKRMLHSAMYLTKTKGTRTSLNGIMNVYGISAPMLQIKETAYPSAENYIISDEATYALQFSSSISNRIQVPLYSSSISASAFYVRFKPELKQSSSLFSGDDKWAVYLEVDPSTTYTDTSTQVNVSGSYRVITTKKYLGYGRVSIISGSNKIRVASSSYFPLFEDDFTSLMLRSQSADYILMQSDGDQILYQYSGSSNISSSIWNSTRHVHIGGSGSIRLNNFDGMLDEVRVWGEPVTNDAFTKLSYDPGAYYGASYSSSYENLYVDLSFSQPLASITQSATNETVYKSASIVTTLPATGFTTASYRRIVRTIRQYSPIIGSTAYTTRKVIVQPPPVFNEQNISENGAYELRRNTSIKKIEQKRYTSGQNEIFFTVSPSDFINSNILRSIGRNINTNNLIGSPAKISGERYPEIDSIYNYYLRYYNGNINAGQYIKFYENLIKAPSEFVETSIPARAKLSKGITIESPILDRKRIVGQRSFRVDGTGTNAFAIYSSGSGNTDTNGMYSFDAIYNVFIRDDFSTITNPNSVTQKIGNAWVTSSLFGDNSGFVVLESTIASSIEAQPSTDINQLAPSKKFTQRIANAWVSSSLANDKSSVDYIEAFAVGRDAFLTQITSSGYPRNPYFGISNRIASEENTLAPFYQIEPTSNFTDLGTTSYFINPAGIYQLPSLTSEYEMARYRTKLDVRGEIASPYSYYDARIGLLPTTSLANAPSRESITISQKTYGPGSTYSGILRTPNILSLIAIEGAAGLRVRLYSDSTKQQSDLSRPFSTVPTASSGVLFDGILDGVPNVFPYTLIQSNNDSLLYFTIDNTTVSTISSDIVMTYFDYQPADDVPKGYLPRHYKFTRRDFTAQKRRNYLGCRIITCQDVCPEGTTEFDSDIFAVDIRIVRDDRGVTVDNPTLPRGGPPPEPNTDPFARAPITLPPDGIIGFGGGGYLE